MKSYLSFLILLGEMTLTLLILRYMSYKYFIVYVSLYSSIHQLHVLYSTLYLLSFSREELNINGKKQELKKEETNNTREKMTNEREKRTSLVIPLEPIYCVRHTHRD